MKYKNGVQYEGTFAGVAVTFSLVNFSEKVVDEFNRRLADEARAKLSAETERSLTN